MYAGGETVFRKAVAILLLLMLALFWAREAAGQPDAGETAVAPGRHVVLLDIDGPIGPATRDYLSRAMAQASGGGAALIVIRMDTPGGLDASTRDIIQDILASPVPVATWVTPSGARAASAGTYILYASHIAAMSPATNVGAATPVAIGGAPAAPGRDQPHGKEKPGSEAAEDDRDGSSPEADGAAASADAMTRKAVNDSVAYIRGLAEMRGRNADWAESAVREAVSITSDEALERGVIDLVADSLGSLLEQIDGRRITLASGEVELATRGLPSERIEPDWRSELLAVITSPTIAYLLLLIGVYGLILEGYNPGAILPGVVGAICLLVALYALQMLPVNYAGLGLIVLGVILMIAEVMAPSFGALGFGGIIAIVIGSVILIDTDAPGFAVSRPLIGSIAAVASLGLLGIVWVALRARRRPVVSGREELLGAPGVALESFERDGHVFVHGERWNARTEAPLREGQAVVVDAVDGLTLGVSPANQTTEEREDV